MGARDKIGNIVVGRKIFSATIGFSYQETYEFPDKTRAENAREIAEEIIGDPVKEESFLERKIEFDRENNIYEQKGSEITVESYKPRHREALEKAIEILNDGRYEVVK